ncbi:MAG: hypothetical protein HY735_36490 [Verrucomicrobia bacterium]|nr:hypothetical protein [Verrucomicrobiota bacterium]
MKRRLALNVVIAYDTFESGLTAAQLYQHTIQNFSADYLFEVAFWRFEVLCIPFIADRAAAEAAQADMIILAVDNGEKLPDEIRDWIEKWVIHKPGRDSALVFVSRNPAPERRAAVANQAYLRDIALRGEMTFLTDLNAKPAEAENQAVREIRPSTRALGPAAQRLSECSDACLRLQVQ